MVFTTVAHSAISLAVDKEGWWARRNSRYANRGVDAVINKPLQLRKLGEDLRTFMELCASGAPLDVACGQVQPSQPRNPNPKPNPTQNLATLTLTLPSTSQP